MSGNMALTDKLSQALKAAMKAKDGETVGALRLILAVLAILK